MTQSLMAAANVKVWWLGDGKPGHENQSLGLAEALARRTACEIFRIGIPRGGPVARVRAACRGAAGLPPPDLILAAGHATHLPLLWLARKYRARSVVLMRPSLPAGWFDLCIVPRHDFPHGGAPANVLLTRGALNRVVAGSGPRAGGLFLIGGPSRTHGWDPARLLGALGGISAGAEWTLTDSRRTPEPFLREIEETLPHIRVFPHQETTPEWLPGKLATAAEVWVTEDSVSMVHEALSSGARVGLLPVPRTDPDSRVLRGLDELVKAGFLTTFATWQETRELPAPPEILCEADRCAGEVLRRVSL